MSTLKPVGGRLWLAAGFSCLALLSACSSSSDDPDVPPPPPPANRAPTANAGSDANGTTGQTITLTGSATDPDGDTLTYQWSVVSGPANGATLTNATSASAQFQATVAGTYVVELTTRDPSNAASSASITLTIAAPPNAVTSIALDRPVVFLTGIGQSATLVVELRDANGAPVTTSVNWTSSQPNQVNVDSGGRVMATGIGSALITASVDGVTSVPVLVTVAEPKPGAVLVTDSQVESVGDFVGLAAGASPGIGAQYEVRLRGVPAPAAGTVMLAAETSPVAGKVVSTRTEGEILVVTLELAPLYDLLARYHIDWNIDLSQFPIVLTEPPANASEKARARARARAASRVAQTEGPGRPLQNFWCEGDLEAKVGNIQIDASATAGLNLVLKDYRDDPTLPPNYSRHSLEGSATFNGSAAIVFNPSVTASGTCRAEAHFQIPALGWVSLIVMPQVSLGVGLELSAELIVASAQAGGTLQVQLKPTVGWECGGEEPSCRSVDDVTVDSKFTPELQFHLTDAMHAEMSGHLFAYARLDALVLGGLAGYVPILEARMGPKQSLNLAFEDTQAKNTSMASDYDLKIDSSIKPGAAIKDAIKKLVNDDAIGVSFSIKQPIPIAESPKGTLRASKARAAIGDTVQFNVDITPATKDYVGLGPNFGMGYNIDSIELWRMREDEVDYSFFRNVPPIASGDSTAFMYEWIPAADDAGKHKFAAFVNTKYPVPHLEVAPDSIKEVEIGCFTSGGKIDAAIRKTASATDNVCANVWNGTSQHLVDHAESLHAQVTWTREENPPPGTPTTLVTYHASGSFDWHYLVFEEAGCTVSPTHFTISQPSALSTNSLTVDYSFTPAKFAGAGVEAIMVTVTCPDSDPFTTPVSASWFNGSGEVSADGRTISGSTSVPGASSSFSFMRP